MFSSNSAPCPCPGFEDFGKEPAEDKNNIAPRAGFTYDAKADGDLVFRGGAGRYYDFAYTNANILFAVIGAQSSFGQVYLNNNSAGIRNADGTLYQVGQPLPANQLTNVTLPLPSHAATPIIKQPYTDQANFGFSKNLGTDFAVEVDGVYAEGKELGMRPALNRRINGGPRGASRASCPVRATRNFRVDLSEGHQPLQGRQPDPEEALGRQAAVPGQLHPLRDDVVGQPARDRRVRRVRSDRPCSMPFGDPENPTRTDYRHRVTRQRRLGAGLGAQHRADLPLQVGPGVQHHDWHRRQSRRPVRDLPAGVETLNSGRGADFKQLDLRVSKKFKLGARAGVEVIAEGFNLTNADNPNTYIALPDVLAVRAADAVRR